MRYWAYFAAKLAAAAGVFYPLAVWLGTWFPREGPDEFSALDNAGNKLLLNLAFMLWFLLAAGALYLIVRDQRYRCRVCLRRLRMPVGTGSWGKMLLLGRPRIEYICPYGHGTLTADQLQISGLANPEWTPQSGSMWDELCASVKDPADRE